ncbi:hypothetical protein A2U01_0116848, partial [Trifolium medium]|nr:hypothetical protein [Trifolium medium]
MKSPSSSQPMTSSKAPSSRGGRSPFMYH